MPEKDAEKESYDVMCKNQLKGIMRKKSVENTKNSKYLL